MLRRSIVFVCLLATAWCVMVCTHELGHLLGGWYSGARLRSFDLAPWRLPYSSFDPNPWPLVTLWSGPVLGVMAPLGLALIIRTTWAWLVAWFCVLANGIYLALGWLSGDRYLDSTQLLAHGASPITIAVYCLVTIIPGYLGFRAACLQYWTDSGEFARRPAA